MNSILPRFFEPWNIKCSKRCAKPVRSRGSMRNPRGKVSICLERKRGVTNCFRLYLRAKAGISRLSAMMVGKPRFISLLRPRNVKRCIYSKIFRPIRKFQSSVAGNSYIICRKRRSGRSLVFRDRLVKVGLCPQLEAASNKKCILTLLHQIKSGCARPELTAFALGELLSRFACCRSRSKPGLCRPQRLDRVSNFGLDHLFLLCPLVADAFAFNKGATEIGL